MDHNSSNTNIRTDVPAGHSMHQATHEDDHGNGNGHHHHEETFITKYIFSQDHKMIAKQFLATGMF
jgi:cytochrome c oxidase subunit 1